MINFLSKYLFMSFTFVLCLQTNVLYANELKSPEHEQWLLEQYGEQHQKLIPIVAVADMFFTCNNATAVQVQKFTIIELVNEMDKEELASRLSECLGEYSIKSDKALNYGLSGCFQAQLAHLPLEDRTQKIKLVNSAIAKLSRAERQKSFTQCVTDQSMKYLK